MTEYVGVLHVHTTFSDGSDSPRQTIAAAAEAGLDFLVVSDHDSDGFRRHGFTGWQDKVLCISAPEIGAKGNPHFTTFGVEDIASLADKESAEALSLAARAGGCNIIAHPHSARIAFYKRVPVDWKHWDTQDFCGIELWSYLHDVCDRTVPWAAPLLLWAPNTLIRGPRAETLQLWDRLLQQRPVAAVGALDNHAHRTRLGTIVPHRKAFRALRTHVICQQLPQDASEAELLLTRAICAGNSWLAMDLWADSCGFMFNATSGDGSVTGMGESRCFSGDMTLHIRSPRPADLAIVHSGSLLEFRRGSDGFDLPLRQPGVYRAEAHLGRRAWVLTNPIYLNLDN